jgi:flagellar assembly protein FliH
MRSESRFIPGEEIGAVEQWNFSAVDTASLLLAAQVRAREKTTIQTDKDDALKKESFALGFKQGLAQGKAEGALKAQQQIADYIAQQGQSVARDFAKLFACAQDQLNAAEEVIAQGTLELACEVARQVLRHELSVNTKVVLPVVREALGLLTAQNKSAKIRLNPADLKLIDETVRSEFSDRSLSLVADPGVARGGCIVESAGSIVDARVQKSWTRAIANLGLEFPWDASDDQH